MKITLDLPDDLMRRVKLRAAQDHQKLDDEVANLIECGLRDTPEETVLPFVPKPTRLRGRFQPGIGDIEAAIAFGRDE